MSDKETEMKRRKKLQNFRHRIDVAEMNIRNTSDKLIEAVKNIMNKDKPLDRQAMETEKPVKPKMAKPQTVKPKASGTMTHEPEKLKLKSSNKSHINLNPKD